MKFKRAVLTSVALAALATPVAASAATLLFDYDGDDGRSFTFTLEQGQAPDSSTTFPIGDSTFLDYSFVDGTFTGPGGTTDTARSIFFGTGVFAEIQVNADGFGGSVFDGPDLFDGSEIDPQFFLGEFELEPGTLNFGSGGTLTISQVAAVPEPATWAMMLFGFGFAGMMLRRRKTRSQVNYAF